MATVIRRFRDKETGLIHEKNTAYNGDDERVQELQEKGFLEVAGESIGVDGLNIEDMTIAQLYEFAEQIEVEIPKEIKKRDDIINFLSDEND